MTQPKSLKIAVTGAAGQLGYAFLFRLATGQVFGENTFLELHLLEKENALTALKGVQMELEDGAFPLLKNIICSEDPNIAFQEVDWAFLIGASPRKAGMERSDLLLANAEIFVEQGKALERVALPHTRVLVVGNPCNTNALIASHHAPRIPRENFYALMMLDETRARASLAKKATCPVSTVKKMAIWGNHSASLFPDFYHAEINDRAAIDVVNDLAWLQKDFIACVQKRGAEVIAARGLSSAASAANAIVLATRSLLTDTASDDWFSMAIASRGDYGIDEGLFFSYPCKMRDGKLHVVKNIEHNDFAKEKIKINLEELKRERDVVLK
jgi:malate dehydrogenase